MTRPPPLPLIVAFFALAFLVPAWPWLSGAVTVPYDAKSTGFATTPKKTGTWIMWAGTPYAHLMVNQTP